MNPAPSPQPERLDEQLVAYHEALLAGASPPPDSDALPPALEQCLKLVDRVRRQKRTDDAERLFGQLSGENEERGSATARPAEGNIARDGDESPRQIGRFRIERRIGEGGFGVVFLAVDPVLNRRVALKLPRPETIISSSWRSRFLREAEAAALLDHPHIVPVHEVGEAGSLCYIVQAWCDGVSLDRWLAAHGACRSPLAAAELVATLAETVQHAHSRGVLHRDIKPSNILLESPASPSDEQPAGADQGEPGTVDTKSELTMGDTAAGPPAAARDIGANRSRADAIPEEQLSRVARLADFGLARLIERGAEQTRSGSVLGTPSYMAPEQAEGRLRDVGAAADVYSLGAVLFELLAGRPPFREVSLLATLQAVREREPPSLRSLRGEVPIDLDAICLKCLEKNPQRRYATAGALAEDLRRLPRGEVVSARTISSAERLLRWCRRNRTLSGLAAAVLLLVTALLVGTTTAAIWLAQAQQKTLDSLEAEIVAKDKATASEELALRAVFEARLAEARASRTGEQPRGRTEALDALAKAAAHIERLKLDKTEILRLRNEAIAAMALVDLRLDRQWPGHPPRYQFASTGFDAEVERYAALEPDGQIAIRRLKDNALVLRVGGLGRLDRKPCIQFSPNGRFLAVRGINEEQALRVQLWELSRVEQPILDEPAGGELADRSIEFSPDSQRLAFAGADGTVQFFGIETRKMARPLALGWSPDWLRFSPSGDRLATVTDQADVVLFLSPATGQGLALPLKHAASVHDAAWSSSGQLLATACRDWRVHVWDAAAGRRLASCDRQHGTVHHVAFDPTDDLLMSSGWNGTTIWDPLSGRALVRSIEGGVRFSRDGRWLSRAIPGVVAGRWEVAPRREYFTLSGHLRDPYVYALAFHPGGRLLASAAAGDGIRLWDVAGRREVA
ncbi:MAG TPA: serine/threonine-protein kinase, partial [Pirellulaceae bacterium]|nr:serine/threonine-protein kinase [Pirellulaceae bacterium]